MFQAARLRPNIAERTTDISVARSLVANGFGFGLINMRTKTNRAADGEWLAFIRLRDAVRPVVLGLTTKQVDHRSRIVAAFFDHVRARVENDGIPGQRRPTKSRPPTVPAGLLTSRRISTIDPD